MIIKTPYKLYDSIMTSGRIQSYIDSIDGIFVDGKVGTLVFGTNKISRVRPNEIKGFEEIEECNYKTLEIKTPYEIGEEVLFINSTYGNVGILAKGKIIGIKFAIGNGYEIFHYVIDTKRGTCVDSYNIYKNKEDFIRRTEPKMELKEDERFLFTEYLIAQNKLVAKKIIERTQVNSIVSENYGNCSTKRSTLLYTSKEKFYKKMFSQL